MPVDQDTQSGEAFQTANYVWHHTDLLTEEGRTAVLIHQVVDHYAVSTQGIGHLEATAIWVTARKPVNIVVGDLNANHVDWNTRLITRDRLLLDYANENSCLI